MGKDVIEKPAMIMGMVQHTPTVVNQFVNHMSIRKMSKRPLVIRAIC